MFPIRNAHRLTYPQIKHLQCASQKGYVSVIDWQSVNLLHKQHGDCRNTMAKDEVGREFSDIS